jgi:hypothetical protein
MIPISPSQGPERGRGLLIGLAIALVCCVAVISWQAGRLSAVDDAHPRGRKSKRQALAVDTGTWSGAANQNTPTSRRSGNHWAFDTDAPKSSNASGSSSSSRSSSSQPRATEPSGSGAGQLGNSSQSEAAQVRSYFTQMDLASASAPASSDPHAMAGDLLGQAANGDFSGLDALAENQQQIIDQIKMVVPPEPCKEHHRRTISTMEQGREMLVNMKTNMVNGDIQKLMLSSVQSQAITQEAEAVDRLGQQLRTRYNIQ